MSFIKKPKYDYALFDLDGTVSDSRPGIFSCFRHALSHFNIVEESDDALRKVIGPPLSYSFSSYYGLTPEETETAIKKYRELYTVSGIYENTMYDGVKEVLDSLFAANIKILLATSKPKPFAVRVLELFGIKEHFCFISAPDLDQDSSEKEDIIRHALEGVRAADKSKAIMIGDRKYDMIGATANGI